MKNIYPLYIKEFECIASKCPDTCCAGWEIVVDDRFQKIYKESLANAAKDAVASMYRDSDGDVCLKLKNGRCPMLTENNLCRLYTEMGKDALCDVCRIYPRFNKECENLCFSGISLSCPEAARLIITDKSKGKLCAEPAFNNDMAKYVFERYSESVSAIKKGAFLINQDSSIPHTSYMLIIAKALIEAEILTDEWKNICSVLLLHLKNAISNPEYSKKRDAAFKAASFMDELKNIEIYFLYKYLPEAIDFFDTDELAKRCFICSSVICEIYAMEIIKNSTITFDKVLRVAQLFSKEIEHSEDNLEELITIL